MISKKSKKLDLTLNVIFNICNLVALLYLIRISSDAMVPLVFSIFMLVRRYAAAIANFLQLGSSQTLLRYLPILGNDTISKRRLFVFGNALYAALLLCVIFIGYFASDSIAKLFFGDSGNYVGITFWMLALSVVTVGQFLVFSAALAERRIIIANVINFFSTTGWLLIAIIFCVFLDIEISDLKTLEAVLAFHTTSIFLSSFLAFAYFMRKFGYRKYRRGENVSNERSWSTEAGFYWHYGLPRTAITFLDGLTLVIGPWFLRQYPIEAGYVVVALSVLRVLQGILMPISQLSGVFAAESLNLPDKAYLSRMVRFMVGSFLLVTLLSVTFLIHWIDILVRAWLSNPKLADGVLRYKWMILCSILPFVLFNGLKTTIENIWHSPKNLWSLLCAFAAFGVVFFALAGFLDKTASLTLAYLAMFWILGGACIAWLKQYLSDYLRYYLLIDWAIAVILVSLSCYFLRSYMGAWGLFPSLIVSFLITVMLVLKSPSGFFYDVRMTFLKKV